MPDQVDPNHILHVLTSDASRKAAEKLFKLHVQDEALYHPRFPAFLIELDRTLAKYGGRPPEEEDKRDIDDPDPEDDDDYDDDEDLHGGGDDDDAQADGGAESASVRDSHAMVLKGALANALRNLKDR